MADAKCDQRVNFRGMWGNVGLRTDTWGDRVLGQPGRPISGHLTDTAAASPARYWR